MRNIHGTNNFIHKEKSEKSNILSRDIIASLKKVENKYIVLFMPKTTLRITFTYFWQWRNIKSTNRIICFFNNFNCLWFLFEATEEEIFELIPHDMIPG